jgi:hypothetical protein
MAETRETGPAVARTCLGGLTLLLALTLSVRAVAISTGVPAHRPAVVEAVARFFAATVSETPDHREPGSAVQTARISTPRGPGVATRDRSACPASVVRVALMNLPPPARA